MKVIHKPFVLSHEFEDATVEIKALTVGDRSEIQDACMTRRFVRDENGNPDVQVEFNFSKERSEVASRAVVGWSGFEDEAGVEIPFSTKNVLVLIAHVDGLWDFIREKLEETNEAKARRDADLQKN